MKTRRILTVTALLLSSIMMVSCFFNGGGNSEGGNSADGKGLIGRASGDITAYESSDVNGLEQALPQIMVIPSDQVLQNFKCLKTETVQGRTYIIRDYKNYLLKDDRARRLFSSIQSAFNDQDFPLNDFEQTLKQLDTQEAMDLADGLDKDTKTLLLMTARPDIILELDYSTSRDKQVSLTSHDYSNNGEKNVNYTLTALDAYTNKAVATITASNIKGESTTETIQASLANGMPKFQDDIIKYFSDILTRGRDITVRVAVAKGCNIKLSDDSIEGDTYADWIIDYIKAHTVKGAYKMQSNTDKELSFTNCRIKLINEDGTQYGVYDWTRDLAKNLRKNLGLKVTNKAQGLGEVMLVIQNQ